MIQKTNRTAITIAEKHDIDIKDALNKMEKSSISLIANQNIKDSEEMQVAFLTALNISKRVFLGGIYCELPKDCPNRLKLKANSFKELVKSYGGLFEENSSQKSVKLLFGIAPYSSNEIEVVHSGWRGGINFCNQERIILNNSSSKVMLGAIASASIACYIAFNKIFSVVENLLDVNTGISLWDLNAKDKWHELDGPETINLPRNIWTLGLGHLGQAYLWTLGFLPYSQPQKTIVLLEDHDIVAIENIGSQILSSICDIDSPKTRPCSSFLESLGFKTQIIEKKFEESDQNQEWRKNYPFLINGVDNVATRKSIQAEQLELFLDGATNGGLQLFDSFTLKNVRYLKKNSNIIWNNDIQDNVIIHKNLYDRYQKSHNCGELTNIGVSTPFVGVFGAVINISELLRALNKGIRYTIVTLQLRDLKNIEAIEDGYYDNSFLKYSV